MITLDLSKRTTTEIVVLWFTALICVVMTLVILGVIIVRIVHPEVDISKAGDAIFNMLSTIIGALVGFISGRAYGKREAEEANGK